MIYAVIIPVFNEAALFPQLLARLEATPPVAAADGPLTRRIYIIDDGSTDGTRAFVESQKGRDGISVILHDHNQGKGASVRSGVTAALSDGADVLLIQDADLEYSPADHAPMLAPILDGRADAVFGTRFLGETHRVLYFWHSVANRAITLLCNMMTNLNLTDIECCLKAVRSDVARRLDLKEERFGIEPEVVAKVAGMRLPVDGSSGKLRRARVYEVAVTYAGRTYEEGKKIRWTDGLAAVWCIVRYSLSN